MVRCKKGTQKNRNGQCVPVVKLNDDAIEYLMEQYDLSPRSMPILRKLRLKKTCANPLYSYNKKKSEHDNLVDQVSAYLENKLQKGSPNTRKKFRTPERFQLVKGVRL